MRLSTICNRISAKSLDIGEKVEIYDPILGESKRDNLCKIVGRYVGLFGDYCFDIQRLDKEKGWIGHGGYLASYLKKVDDLK